ncbi:NAD(P)H-dependent flavin oxidoreductase [Sphingobium sp. SCG-1]|uniref:NAD(P)H-dependent flavin oxidoreductase n=1 Tax=Sphingobium sp. SCG-1 TaxID=2072936 RepID=UPI001CB9C792|nr:nitronate monooxygenase [Sphingobium sp. SCG-1]
MFLISGPDLVVAACRSGIIGAFPAANARTPEQLQYWLATIEERLAGRDAASYAVNINVWPGRYRDFDAVVAAMEKAHAPLVITSVGDPTDTVRRVHGWGGKVLHDVTTIRHAEKAIAAGVDGLILICAGAGGHAGAASPFSFLRAVRKFYDGPVVLGGGIGDGHGVAAAIALGADMVYMGTRFIASAESMAGDAYKRSVVDAELSDIVYTNAISGLPANFLSSSLVAAGLNLAHMPDLESGERARLPAGIKAWKDILSAGHASSLVDSVLPVDEIVRRIGRELEQAVEGLNGKMGRNRVLTT